MKTLCIGELVKTGWKEMKNRFGFFVVALLLVMVTFWVIAGIARFADKTVPVLGIIFHIIDYIFQIVIGLGWIKISLKIIDGQKPLFRDLYNNFNIFFKCLIAQILYCLMLIAGTILLVFPAVIWGIRYGFYQYFIVEEGAGPIEALKKSAALTMGAKWDLFALNLVTVVIGLCGVLCLIVGLFAAMPVCMIAHALAYRKLLLQSVLPEVPSKSE